MPTHKTSVAQFAEAQAAARLKALESNLRRVAKDPGKAKPIHDLRVSIRRFTRVLRVFRLLWDRGHYRKMRRRLRELMDLCGAARNCDIAAEVLKAAGAQVPASGERDKGAALKLRRLYASAARRCSYLLTHYLPKRRRKAEENLAQLLQLWKAEGISKSWQHWLHANFEHDQDLETFARRNVLPLVDEYFETGDRAARSDASFEELHQFRLLAKKLRYSLEIFGPAAGPDWELGIAEIRAMQDLLGAINDCVSTRALIAGTGNDGSNILVKMLANVRFNRFRWDWEHQKKSRAWWLRWVGKKSRRRAARRIA